MNSRNIQQLWTRLIVEELVRTGVTTFCVSPGSRNSPLVMSVAENSGAEAIVHPDERGASFYALGYGKARGAPAVLICTSGTAVANYLPAVVEASNAMTPMIILSADRPIVLRDTGANQTIDQVGMFGRYTRWDFDLPSPTPEITPRFVLTTIDQAVYRATRSPAGPVHINCQFSEPLTPDSRDDRPSTHPAELERWERSCRPLTSYISGGDRPRRDESIGRVMDLLKSSRRGLIVAGAGRHPGNNAEILEAAEALGMPILADVASGLRFGKYGKRNLVSHYDLILRDREFAVQHRPDLMIHLGGPLVSASANTYIEESDADYIVVRASPDRRDPAHRVTHRIEAAAVDFCRSIRDAGDFKGSELLSDFRKADAAYARVLNEIETRDDSIEEFLAARVLLSSMPDNSALFLANSMPVRDADSCGVASDHDVAVSTNRGASGIDGTIASTVGFADGMRRRGVLLTGDLAFLHDLNSLLLLESSGFPVTIVVINNNGGAIFSFLPIADHNEHFERFFGAPHGLNFGEIVRGFGLDYRNPRTMAEFEEVCRAALESDRSCVIELNTDRRQNVVDHKAIWDNIRTAR